MEILIVGLGGFFGAISRFLVGKLSVKLFGQFFPHGTLVVNVFGAFLLGLFYTLIANKMHLSPHIRLFIGVGFLGAFTTFSSFSVETVELVKTSGYGVALVNIVLNVVLSLVAAYCGMLLAKGLHVS